MINKGRTFLDGLTSLIRRLHPLVTYLPRFEKPLRGCWSLKSYQTCFRFYLLIILFGL